MRCSKLFEGNWGFYDTLRRIRRSVALLLQHRARPQWLLVATLLHHFVPREDLLNWQSGQYSYSVLILTISIWELKKPQNIPAVYVRFFYCVFHRVWLIYFEKHWHTKVSLRSHIEMLSQFLILIMTKVKLEINILTTGFCISIEKLVLAISEIGPQPLIGACLSEYRSLSSADV